MASPPPAAFASILAPSSTSTFIAATCPLRVSIPPPRSIPPPCGSTRKEKGVERASCGELQETNSVWLRTKGGAGCCWWGNRCCYSQSDHLTQLRAYMEWDALAGPEKFSFCRHNFLGIKTLQVSAEYAVRRFLRSESSRTGREKQQWDS